MNIEGVEYTHNSNKNTIWMDKFQIAKIYGKPVEKIEEFIHGIFSREELKYTDCAIENIISKKIVKSAKNISILREKYNYVSPIFYNHEVVLLVGYLIDPKKAEAFEEFLEYEFGIKDRTRDTDKIIDKFIFEGKNIECIGDIENDENKKFNSKFDLGLDDFNDISLNTKIYTKKYS